MLALDTNVLLRVLVDDPGAPAQCTAARSAVAAAGEVFIPQVVQVETVWVLGGVYGLGKAALQKALAAIASHPAFHLQRPEVFRVALRLYLEGHQDFADCMILAECMDAGVELASFDRKLGKLAGVRQIG